MLNSDEGSRVTTNSWAGGEHAKPHCRRFWSDAESRASNRQVAQFLYQINCNKNAGADASKCLKIRDLNTDYSVALRNFISV